MNIETMHEDQKAVADAASVSFARRFWPLVALGVVGIASLPLVMLPTLRLLIRDGHAPGISLPALAALTLIQPTLLLVAAAAIGAVVAPRLGLASHVAKVNVRTVVAAEVPLALVYGVATGIVVVALDMVLFHAHSASASSSARTIIDGLVGGALYGGVTEEIMMRWGLMSLIVWAGARLFARTTARPGPGVYRGAIVIVALLFAAGHLPAAMAIAPLTTTLVLRILLLNALAGLVFGWLFWRKSLECAMFAHASVHVVFAIGQALGWG
jgi:hypothetical protein